MKTPIISLLTDFGSRDHYVGAMKGVMLSICPGAQLVDITHEVPSYEIAEGAWTLAQACACFPKGTVHLVVVDPGVGSSRRPILAEASGHIFVAPDNGVLTLVLNAAEKHRVREITASRYFREPVSRTFHGRDIFAPVAAHLASGVPASQFGPEIENSLRLTFSEPVRTARRGWTGAILKIDGFGNVITNFDWARYGHFLDHPFEMQVGLRNISRVAPSYSEIAPGEICVIQGSAGYVEVAAHQASAAQILGVAPGAPVELRAASSL